MTTEQLMALGAGFCFAAMLGFVALTAAFYALWRGGTGRRGWRTIDAVVLAGPFALVLLLPGVLAFCASAGAAPWTAAAPILGGLAAGFAGPGFREALGRLRGT